MVTSEHRIAPEHMFVGSHQKPSKRGNRQTIMYQNRICKSCEPCRARKVRCIVSSEDPSRCRHCINRGERCEFKQARRRFKHQPQKVTREPSLSSLAHGSREYNDGRTKSGLAPLFVDQLLDSQPLQGMLQDEVHVLRSQENEVCSSNLAFFSDRKIQSLTQKLGNSRLKSLVDWIEAVIEGRVTARGATSISPVTFKKPLRPTRISAELTRAYVDVYFTRIHPMYPFLDRQSFEETAFSATLAQTLETTPAFSALYHAVLALGCQYHDGGSFDPGKGKAWKFFQMSLGLMADILVPQESLLSLQALTAMSIFAMNTCCLQIDEILIMEAARMAHALRYHRAICSREQQVWCLRTFWVIYGMEKQLAFQNRENSLIADYNVGCPIPETPEANFGSYNWFLSSIRFARITSQAYELLFSISATQSSTETYYTTIDYVQERLEKWRLTVPEPFRPGESCPQQTFNDPVSKMVALQTHYSYYSMVIALARLTLQIGSDDGARQDDSRRSLMASARRIIELTQYIDKAPHTPLFILAIMPLVALFLLFDFVVHNPTHSETKTNLAMLDIVSGHFAFVEHASNGSLPCSLVSEFAHIARQHVKDINGGRGPGDIMDAPRTPTQRPFRGHIRTGSSVVSETHMPVAMERNTSDNQRSNVELSGGFEPYKHTDSVGQPAGDLYYSAMDASFDFGSDPLLPGVDLRTLFGSVISGGFDSPEDAPSFGGIMPTPPT